MRKIFHRLDEAHARMLHDEADSGAMRATTETVIKLLALADGKGRGFFVVKRAAGNKISAGFFERHIALDDIHDVEAIEQILNETFWNHCSPRITWCGEQPANGL